VACIRKTSCGSRGAPDGTTPRDFKKRYFLLHIARRNTCVAEKSVVVERPQIRIRAPLLCVAAQIECPDENDRRPSPDALFDQIERRMLALTTVPLQASGTVPVRCVDEFADGFLGVACLPPLPLARR
jgi:hypothetical protein